MQDALPTQQLSDSDSVDEPSRLVEDGDASVFVVGHCPAHCGLGLGCEGTHAGGALQVAHAAAASPEAKANLALRAEALHALKVRVGH
jgi:hypothetical protein